MGYLGQWAIDALLTFPANTHAASTGAATDADSVPSYRVYEDETGTAILTGSMAKLDDANTVGFYSEQITLSAANGFEVGKCYTIYISATVSSVVGTMSHTFQVEAAPATASALATLQSNVTTLVNSIISDEGIRDAIGLASANLDTQLGNLPTLTELLDAAVEGSITLEGALRLMLSVLTGKSSGGGTGTVTYRDTGDTKNRAQFTVDSNGNRSAVTRNTSD